LQQSNQSVDYAEALKTRSFACIEAHPSCRRLSHLIPALLMLARAAATRGAMVRTTMLSMLYRSSTIIWHHRAIPDEHPLTLRQADQARADFAVKSSTRAA